MSHTDQIDLLLPKLDDQFVYDFVKHIKELKRQANYAEADWCNPRGDSLKDGRPLTAVQRRDYNREQE